MRQKQLLRLKKIRQASERLRVETIASNAELERQISILERIADDATRGFSEREVAAKKLNALQKELNSNLMEQAKLNEQAAIADAKIIKDQKKEN